MIIFAYFTDPLRGTPEEQLFKILGVPAIGAAVGGFVGLIIDVKLTGTGKIARESANGCEKKTNCTLDKRLLLGGTVVGVQPSATRRG